LKNKFALLICVFTGCVTPPIAVQSPTPDAKAAAVETAPVGPAPIVRKQFKLAAEDYWRIELPTRLPFDASGLALDDKSLLILSDKESVLYRVGLETNHTARLQPAKLLLPDKGDLDWEGLARDEAGHFYACEEGHRWVARFELGNAPVERLDIDWSPVRQYFSAINRNASFEGIAVSGNRLWVANERDRARIIEVDLRTLKVVADFAVQPSTWGLVLHYSDLAFRDGHLFVLLRHHRLILEVDPDSHDVLAEYDFNALEDAPEHRYEKEYPTGNMEGLAIDAQYFWLVTDNNGLPRRQDARDRRPTLFKCRRPL
jgi:uncharacterized protein YjiK